MHVEINQYHELYHLWNFPNYLGPVRTRIGLCDTPFLEARQSNHWKNDKGCYHNTVIGIYTDSRGKHCKVYLGHSLQKSIDFCKRGNIWQDSVLSPHVTYQSRDYP